MNEMTRTTFFDLSTWTVVALGHLLAKRAIVCCLEPFIHLHFNKAWRPTLDDFVAHRYRSAGTHLCRNGTADGVVEREARGERLTVIATQSPLIPNHATDRGEKRCATWQSASILYCVSKCLRVKRRDESREVGVITGREKD